MGSGPEQTFFQGRHINGQQAHEKMFNIINHQGNANQNHDEILPHICQDDYYKKRQQITSVDKDVGNRESLCTIGGNVNWCRHYGKQYGDSSKN